MIMREHETEYKYTDKHALVRYLSAAYLSLQCLMI